MVKGANSTYFGSIWEGITSVFSGLRLTLRHLKDASTRRKTIGVQNKEYFQQDKGIVTVEYPYEAIPVPDNGRYRLHNEIEDCIVCDLCAKICPVNCIEIDAVKSTEEIGKTSDGTTKRLYAAKFDIDMAKCMYCGLCTTVCPTECLTMTKVYDFSEFDVRNFVYHFTDLNPAEADEKKRLYEEKQKEKTGAKEKAAVHVDKFEGNTENIALQADTQEKPKVVPFRPVIKPAAPKVEGTEAKEEAGEVKPAPKPAFKPVIKAPAVKIPLPKKEGEEIVKKAEEQNAEPKISGDTTTEKQEVKPAPKPVFKPVIKAPAIKIPPSTEGSEEKKAENTKEEIKPSESKAEDTPEIKPVPKPVFKPVIKPPLPKKDKEE